MENFKIIVAYDFQELSDVALKQAYELARFVESGILLVSVVNDDILALSKMEDMKKKITSEMEKGVAEQLKNVAAADALRHPNWDMGKKITIDSATLMNKGLELIEAMHLFDISPDQIEVLIHPESIIHSMVEFTDGSTIAQLSNPDMRQPIQYALTYPDRLPSLTKQLNLTEIKKLTFEKPDMETFPCLRLAYEAAHKGTPTCAILNQANEEAVELFLSGKIGFNEIPAYIEQALNNECN